MVLFTHVYQNAMRYSISNTETMSVRLLEKSDAKFTWEYGIVLNENNKVSKEIIGIEKIRFKLWVVMIVNEKILFKFYLLLFFIKKFSRE